MHKHKDETPRDAGAAEEGASEKVTLSRADYETLREKAAKADEHWDKLLRTNADFDNTKKRLEKRSQDLVKYGNEKLILEMIGLIDDLDRAIASLDQGHDLKMVRQGMHLAQGAFHKVLEQNGVEAVESAGKPFDPNLHEAVGEVETDDVEEGHVAEEIQKGYLLNGRLARPSRVRIAKRRA